MPTSESGIRVRVQPGSSRDEILGLKDGVVHLRVKAPPVGGKANRAVVKLLSETLGVPSSKVRLARGHASRNKHVAVDGLSAEDVHRRLGGNQGQ